MSDSIKKYHELVEEGKIDPTISYEERREQKILELISTAAPQTDPADDAGHTFVKRLAQFVAKVCFVLVEFPFKPWHFLKFVASGLSPEGKRHRT